MKLFETRKPRASGTALPVLNAENLKTRYAESYRTMRTNIYFSMVDENFKALLVTSAGAGEGKTNTVANLAYIFAQAGKSVLMMDCDLRRPMLSHIHDPGSNIGFTGLVANILSRPLDDLGGQQPSLFDILRLIALQKKTGRLQVQDVTDKVELFFLKGHLVDLLWVTRPPEKMLSAVLIENGHLTREQVDIVIKRQQDTGNRMGVIVAKMGFMKKSDLDGVLSIHIMEVLHKLVAMQDSSFVFTDLPAGETNTTTADLLDLEELLDQAKAGHEKLPFIDGFIAQTVQQVDDNLFLMPTGPIPPNPLELLGSVRMDFVINRLKSMYDLLIFDSPPLLPASDALVLAPHADGVLLVVKAGLLHRKMAIRAVEQLRSSQANLLGVVLNQVDTKREGYYKYYYKHYAKYYGEKG